MSPCPQCIVILFVCLSVSASAFSPKARLGNVLQEVFFERWKGRCVKIASGNVLTNTTYNYICMKHPLCACVSEDGEIKRGQREGKGDVRREMK